MPTHSQSPSQGALADSQNGVLVNMMEPARFLPGRLWRGSAEALVAMLALLGFGLMWAGVESLHAERRAPHPGVTTFSHASHTAERSALSKARAGRSGGAGPSWSSAAVEVSWPRDEAIQLADSGSDAGGQAGRYTGRH